MADFPGPISISPLQAPATRELGLRPFQRVTAQVLAVTSSTATLSIEGHPVVAQLTSAEQAAALLSQNKAQFIVAKMTSEGITLKLVSNSQPQAAVPGAETAACLLHEHNLPVTENNLALVCAMAKQQLPLTPAVLNELLGALSGLGKWGSAEAELAAALKAAGLPVTRQSLELASRQVAQTGEALGQLIASLQAAGQNLPPELLKHINENLTLLDKLILNWGENPAELVKQLSKAVSVLGKSLENALLDNPEKSLLSLAELQQKLEQAGEKELAKLIDDFLSDLRQQQFMNLRSDSGREEWSQIGLALRNADEKLSTAHLRIARQHGSSSEKVNPLFTRLVLQVDLEPGKTVEVDLSLAGKQVQSKVIAPDPFWCEQAQNELPSLEEALQQLGFHLKDVQIAVGEPQSLGIIPSPSGNPLLMRVDIEA
jgi:hypothetical protein